MRPNVYDAVVVGSGPNGLAAAIELARNGQRVAVLEAEDTFGGGVRSAEITLPGFVHDLGSAIHPLGVASPFFSSIPLEDHGLEWIHPTAPLAHPFDDGTAAILHRSVDKTAAGLGPDGDAYRKLMAPLSADAARISTSLTGDLQFPRHPLSLALGGLRALRPAHTLANEVFEGGPARGLFAGNAAHSFLPLEGRPSSLFGLVLGATGHAFGWPFPRGGAQKMADALVSYLRTLGGELFTGSRVRSMRDVPPTRTVLFDVTPRQLLDIAGEHFTEKYSRSLGRYKYGPGVFKVDFALDGPIPWDSADCFDAGTVHLGGSLEDVASGEAAVSRGEHPEKPFVLLAQHTLFDDTRAPEGKHTVWAYCHVPNGSTFDMTGRIEQQIERFAPGFRDRILAKTTAGPTELASQNANLIGGDINGGYMDLKQLIARPVPSLNPYSTSAPGLYICSSSTPPGGAAHGLCGFMAARSALRYLRR